MQVQARVHVEGRFLARWAGIAERKTPDELRMEAVATSWLRLDTRFMARTFALVVVGRSGCCISHITFPNIPIFGQTTHQPPTFIKIFR